MTIVLVVLLLLAACLSTAAEVVTARANPAVRLPLWGKSETPRRDPTEARVLRGLATFSALIGAITFNDHIAGVWWRAALWGGVLIVAVFLPALAYRLIQNARVPAQPKR